MLYNNFNDYERSKAMNQYITPLEREQKYAKAKYDLHTAINSFNELDDEQKRRILVEVYAEKQAEAFYNWTQQYHG